MITKILNNDYVLNKIMSFLGVVLVLLGFISCGDEDEKEPYRAACLYGVPSVDFAVRGEIAGLVTDSVGNPIENININVGLVKQDGTLKSAAASRVGVTGEDGKYKTIVAYFESFVYYGEIPKMDLTGFKNNFPSYIAVATDSTGVYENDTLYIDYALDRLDGDELFNYTSTSTADFVLHKKKN